MDWQSIILAIITFLLTGTNVITLVNNRILRRKLSAQAEQEETNSLRLIIEGNVAEIARLQQRVDDYANRYDNLLQKYSDLQRELFDLRNLIGK